MELVVSEKGNKYFVNDEKSKLLYTVKKKGFSAKFNLLDANNYILYTLVQDADGKKPAFTIILNDNVFLHLECKSLFLDPTVVAEGNNMNFKLVSTDRKYFQMTKNGKNIGEIKTIQEMGGALRYEITIENIEFDDYIPLFAVALDRAFGDMNKQ
jgi:hypothetical protein